MPTTFGRLSGSVPPQNYTITYPPSPAKTAEPPLTREELSRQIDYATDEDMPQPGIDHTDVLNRLESDAQRRRYEEEMLRRSCLEFAIKYEGADDKPSDVVARAGTYYNFVKNGIDTVAEPTENG